MFRFQRFGTDIHVDVLYIMCSCKLYDGLNFRKVMLCVCRHYLNAFPSCFFREFRNDFLELLRRRFGKYLKSCAHNDFIISSSAQGQQCPNFFLGTKRVHNNIVYNEYISHREHIHMNATQWETLTDFTKWLGREGKSKTWCEQLLYGCPAGRERVIIFSV